MKVFILGGSGFVGGHLARRLAADGHEITIATRYAPGARHLLVVPRTRICQCNPYDLENLTRALEGHDVAINLVGILNERGFGGKGFRKVHVELVEKLLISCEAARVGRFVQMSSLNAGQGESHYLRSRGEAEKMIAASVRSGHLQATIFQPSTIFGRDDSFLNRFASLLKISPFLPLARPHARFAPVYVGDVVEAFARDLANSDSNGKTYQLCGSEVWALRELVIWLRDLIGLRRLVVGLPDVLGRLQALAFDFVPGKPFSSDNFKSLKVDSVCTDNGLVELGIDPWGLSQLAPTWLGSGSRQSRYQRFRRKARRGHRENG
jgi:uncharacterized protein YbjT (DUF2867 family)